MMLILLDLGFGNAMLFTHLVPSACQGVAIDCPLGLFRKPFGSTGMLAKGESTSENMEIIPVRLRVLPDGQDK